MFNRASKMILLIIVSFILVKTVLSIIYELVIKNSADYICL